MNGYYTFVKVEFSEEGYADRPYWYLSLTSDVEAGDIVLAPPKKGFPMIRGRVLKVEKNVSEQCSPVPMNRILEIGKVERGE